MSPEEDLIKALEEAKDNPEVHEYYARVSEGIYVKIGWRDAMDKAIQIVKEKAP